MPPFSSEPSYLRCFTATQATDPSDPLAPDLVQSCCTVSIQQPSTPVLSVCQTKYLAHNSSHLVDTLGSGTQNDSGFASSHFYEVQIWAVIETKLV